MKKLLASLLENPQQGVELYNGMRKVRISFASKGRGKRGGGRVIIQLTVSEDSLTFVYIYDKADMQNVSDEFLDQVIILSHGNHRKHRKLSSASPHPLRGGAGGGVKGQGK